LELLAAADASALDRHHSRVDPFAGAPAADAQQLGDNAIGSTAIAGNDERLVLLVGAHAPPAFGGTLRFSAIKV
jgi:hypothetical protein